MNTPIPDNPQPELPPDELRDAVVERWPEIFYRTTHGRWYFAHKGTQRSCLNGDLLEDRNAVAAIEATLTDEQRLEYTELLIDEVGCDRAQLYHGTAASWLSRITEIAKLHRATPTQQFTALLLTK